MTTIESLTLVGIVSVSTMAFCVTGCANQNLVTASDTTLEAAMTNIGRGLVDLKAAEIEAATNHHMNSNMNFGLMPSSVVVQLNLTAAKGNSNQLVVAASAAPPGIPVSAGVSNSLSSSATGNRMSTITITYNSLYFNPYTNASSSVTNSTNYAASSGSTNVAADKSTNVVNFNTNISWTSAQTRPSNLNDPDTVERMLKIIQVSSTNGSASTSSEHPANK